MVLKTTYNQTGIRKDACLQYFKSFVRFIRPVRQRRIGIRRCKIITCASRRYDSVPEFRLQFIPCRLGHLASTLGDSRVMSDCSRILLSGYFRGRSLCQHIERKLDICHVIPQTLLVQPFESLVLTRRHPAPFSCDDVCQCSILRIFNTATLPLVCQQFPYLYCPHPLVYPTFGIAEPTVIGDSLFYREFRVLHLVKTA